jgi:hypothetical protein
MGSLAAVFALNSYSKSPVVVSGDRLLNGAAAVVAFVPPLAKGRTPVTPLVRGKPVAFVKTTAEGVPNAGVIRVGLVARTTDPLPVVVAALIAVPFP